MTFSNVEMEAFQRAWHSLGQAHLDAAEQRAALSHARQAFADARATRALGAANLFLRDFDQAERCAAKIPVDQARIAQSRGDFLLAARRYEDAGWLAHASFALQDAGDLARCRAMWERFCSHSESTSNLYVTGLALYNLSRICLQLGDELAARRYSIQSIHRLERAADGYEAAGQRERAFDCFLVVMAIGREGGFENLAEGYLGCIRILAGDQLRHYVIQYYEDFLGMAEERAEYHAAGTLCREAADYARDQGLPYAAYYLGRAGDSYVRAGQRLAEAGASPQMVENALAAAIDCFNSLGMWSRIQAIYEQLSTLDLGEGRRERYRSLVERVRGVSDSKVTVIQVPDHLRVSVPYPDVWRSDVLEWELKGDPADTMTAVAVDPNIPEYTRRRAQLCVLFQRVYLRGPVLEVAPAESREFLIKLAELLGDAEAWESLAPLEHLYQSEDPLVRASCIQAVGRLYFKRSFQLISKGVTDEDRQVREAALTAITGLYFPHAFEPLLRIYRSARDAEVKATALRSLGKIRSSEAVDALLEALRDAPSNLESVLVELLSLSQVPTAAEQIRTELDVATGRNRDLLEKVSRAR